MPYRRHTQQRHLAPPRPTDTGPLSLPNRRPAWPWLAVLACLSAASLTAQAQIHTLPIPDHGISAPQIESWADAQVRQAMSELDIPGLTIAASHEGRIVYSKGFGYRDIGDSDPSRWLPMQRWTRSRIGSNSKLLTTAAVMKLIEEHPDTLSLETRVYGANGILDEGFWHNDQRQGARRHNPIVDMAVGENNRVTTWYRDGVFTIGSSGDLDRYRGPRAYSLPPGKHYDDLLAVARGPGNNVWSWYLDGTLAYGSPSDLDAYGAWDSFESAGRRENIVGIAMDKYAYRTYTWYHDGSMSVGTPFDLAATSVGNYLIDDPADRYDIVGMAQTRNGLTVTWFSDGNATKGVLTSLDAIGNRYPYQSRTVSGSIKRWQDWRRQTEIRHLLSHTSGMARSGNWGQALAKYPQGAGSRDYRWPHRYVLSTAPRLFEPGTDSAYSNHGMGLAGYLIERISGEYFDDYIGDRLLAPLGITELVPHWAVPFDPSRDAVEYRRSGNGDLVAVEKHDPDSAKSAAGAYTGAARDVLKFLLAIDGRDNRPDVLSGASVDAMAKRPFPATAPGNALGWGITCAASTCDTRYRLSHSGATGGAVAWVVRFENYYVGPQLLDDIQVVINTNTRAVDASDLAALATDIARIIAVAGTGRFDHGSG